MLSCLRSPGDADSVALVPLTRTALPDWLAGPGAAFRPWVESLGFTAEPGTTALLPGADGRLARVLAGIGDPEDPWAFAGLPAALPAGLYAIEEAAGVPLSAIAATRAALGWALGSYRFTRYRKQDKPLSAPSPAPSPALIWPAGADREAAGRTAEAVALVRDLINTPANDLGPAELAEAAVAVAREFAAEARIVAGAGLLAENYPAIHAVGRASSREPRLIDITWGEPGHPLVALVGKGVCFDSGGLDIKPSAGMLLMKKDMGGAAHVLGIARVVMAARLPVRLRVLIPAVENAVSGDAFRPLDVLRTRKGLSVEVGNTDAEGRLILCDALAEADAAKPDFIIDFATLTGAARVALGTDLPALFCNDDGLAEDLLAASRETADPLWRLPLWQPYRKQLDSKVADLNNAPGGPYAGAITAALFLETFVTPGTPWAHIDLMAWNLTARPGRPEGGEAMGLRAVYALIEKRYGNAR